MYNMSRHYICQIFYTSIFSNIQKFTRRKRVDRNIFFIIQHFYILKLEQYPNFVPAGSFATFPLLTVTKSQKNTYLNCSKNKVKFYPSTGHFTQALLVMLVTNITSEHEEMTFALMCKACHQFQGRATKKSKHIFELFHWHLCL